MAIWDRYKTNVSGFETIAQKGKNFQPRFFADETATGPYQVKAPIAKLIMTPQVQFINTNIAWDVQNSRSPTGTTIDTFDLTFGGGGATDLTAQDFSVDPKTGNVQYTSAGQFTASLTVTDTTGNRSQPATITIDIVDQELIGLAKVYIITDGGGMYTYTSGNEPAQANTGLTASDKFMRSGRLNPHYIHLLDTQHHYWAATAIGLARTVDGAANWNRVSRATLGDPTNSAGDSPAPDTDDLLERCVVYCPQDTNRLYCLRPTDGAWNLSNDSRMFLYWSDDYGLTWDSIGIGLTADFDYTSATTDQALHQHLGVSADGDFVFIVVDELVSGNAVFFKATRPPSPTFTKVYQPGTITIARIAETQDLNKMIFYGDFGTDIGVVDHNISAVTNTDISPPSLGTDEIVQLVVDPNDANHIVAINDDLQDVIETTDNGANWVTLNNAILDVEAFAVLFLGAYFPLSGFIGGDNGGTFFKYYPNDFSSFRDDVGVALAAESKIVNVDFAPGR